MKISFPQNGNYYTYQAGFVKPGVRGSFFRIEWAVQDKLKTLWLLESRWGTAEIEKYLGWVYLEARDNFEFVGRFPRILVEIKKLTPETVGVERVL